MWNIVIADEKQRDYSTFKREKAYRILAQVDSYEYLLAELKEYDPEVTMVSYELIRPHLFTEQWMTAVAGRKVILIVEDGVELKRLGDAVYVLYRPFTPQGLTVALEVLFGKGRESLNEQRKHVSRILDRIGLQPHLDGYRYLRDAILICLAQEERLPLGEIYTRLAKQYEKKTHCIERSMRNTIEKAWVNGDVEYINSLFGFTVNADMGKPSNREFIAMVADCCAYRE